MNSSSPVWQSITVSATGQTAVSGNLFVPKTPEAFSYDPDGNLTNDGRWAYTWDAENRLVKMAANTSVGPQISLQFDYDSASRRIRKQTWGNKTWSGNPTNDLRFAYDGWNLIAALDAQLSTLNTFCWGLDVSGSLRGAGGVGGLLMVWDASTLNSQPSTHFTCFDGNGNVVALVNAADSSVTARYEYGPFGEVIRATGPMATANPFRFSSKYQDDETDLLYYGYRYYNASTGRWLSRDLIEELGGDNLYGFIRNGPTDATDSLGLTAHLSPLNDVIYNYSSHDVYISGDWVDVNFYTPGRGTSTSRPWSYWQLWSILAHVPAGTTVTLTEPSAAHTLQPGHNSAGDWSAGLTRIVDADFLDGAAVPLYSDVMCQHPAQGRVKVSWTLMLSVHDCPTGCPGVFYDGGREE